MWKATTTINTFVLKGWFPD